MKELTNEELTTNLETQKHIAEVQKLIEKICCALRCRGVDHDRSKTEFPEVSIFSEYTSKLKHTTYGSAEYKEHLKNMRPALDHHYQNNRHHPDVLGLENMNLVDIVEMVCDWKAATLRHEDGCFVTSVEHNGTRFTLGKELTQIIMNTKDLLE